MILRALSVLWTSYAPQMANHLWQSTLFVVLAAILSFALRKNQARVRYWVWLTASVKFLIPFSLLIALGSHVAKPRASTATQVIVYSVVEDFSQPFAGQLARQQMPVLYHQAPAAYRQAPAAYRQAPTAAPVSLFHLLPAIAIAVWLVGIVFVLLRGLIGWVRISLMVRKAASVGGGPEGNALRRLESSLGVRKPIRLVLSSDWMEPGVFGIFRPVLIWPEGISKHLDDRHIEAIVAHEVCHVRRHDNLTAVLHMLVEAVFWFHPLVWWMGARLEEERERACDEEVSLLYRQPKIYAESILRVCKFCSESPLACVSGITGADLKKRIVQIMTGRVVRRLDLGRKLLLLVVGLAVVAVPIVLAQAKAAQRMMLVALNAAPRQLQTAADAMMAQGQTTLKADPVADVANAVAPGPGFASVTIRPTNMTAQGQRLYGTQLDASGHVVFSSLPLKSLVMIAYADQQKQQLVDGGPKWTESDLFDINAQVGKADLPDWEKLSVSQRFEHVRPLLQTLLEQRFKLKEHAATISTPVYVLERAKGGSKLKEVPAPTPAEIKAASEPEPNGQPTDTPRIGINVSNTGWVGHAVSIQELSNWLSYALGAQDKPVVDQTGLTGYYDLTLSLIKQEGGPTREQQVEEQLGLRLNARNVPMRTFVIDSVEKPTLDAAGASTLSVVAEPAPPPPHVHFEVVSWKRCKDDAIKGSGRVDMPMDSDFVAYHCQPIHRIIYFAFTGQGPFALSGHPSWVDDDLYEFQAKVAPEDIAVWKAMTINDRRIAVRDILADQLKLQIHVDKTPQPAYALTVAKGGAKLTEYKVGEQWKIPDGRILEGRQQVFIGDVGYLQNATMNNFAADLSARLDRPVVDQTGLTGSYDISLPLTKAGGTNPFANIGDEGGSVESGLALLGLKLVPTKAEADGMMVDHIERPPEN
jgi:bla regulator protein blaR1